MPEYLSKEEIRKWRSSLEKITLEEYAQRLGKVLSEEKETNDMADMVMKTASFTEEMPLSSYSVKVEKISSLAQQSFERETLMEHLRISNEPQKNSKKSATKASLQKITRQAMPKEKPQNKSEVSCEKESTEDLRLTFKKNLTPREQAVFEHFLNNRNHIVYAKELAQVLDLPRDYVYKYIKNLRAKLNEDAIQNADNGGFVLSV